MLAATYFILERYNEAQERVERRKGIERARKELFGFAEAEVHETKKVRDFSIPESTSVCWRDGHPA
jgi:hypothetical protein